MKNDNLLIIATRKSPLAMWQTLHTKRKILDEFPHINVKILSIVTTGDKLKGKLTEFGGKGLFVKELQQALLDERADIAVHSMKDVPNVLPNSTQIIAMFKREDPRDVLVTIHGKALNELPLNSIVGTSSLRRKIQMSELRPDLKVADLRGNVGTRLNKLEKGEYDAIILAKAGLKRLGCLNSRKYKIFDLREMIPAAGQGAIGIEALSNNDRVNKMFAKLNCPNTYRCVMEERKVIKRLGGDCGSPIAAFAKYNNKCLKMEAFVSNTLGTSLIRTVADFPENCSRDVGESVANTLIKLGALKIVAGQRGSD